MKNKFRKLWKELNMNQKIMRVFLWIITAGIHAIVNHVIIEKQHLADFNSFDETKVFNGKKNK